MHSKIPELWLISVPGDRTAHEAYEKLEKATHNCSSNHKFNIPELKVGTLDQLVGLSDDLAKLDAAAECVTRKLVGYFGEVLKDEEDKLSENLMIGGKDIHTYVTKFQWEGGKYPRQQSLKVLSEILAKQVSQIEHDLKTKSHNYSALKTNLSHIDRKATGSLATRDLSDLVKAEDFVLNSEYMQTLLVVVPKIRAEEWEATYSTFACMVVPGSNRKLHKDAENYLYSVTLFKKVIDEWKIKCREKKFVVLDFVYDEATMMLGKSNRERLVQEIHRQHAPIVRWLKINFAEIYSAYIHIKCMRVFIESVLTYGLPINFQALIMEPHKGTTKKVRHELLKLYGHLDDHVPGHVDAYEDMPTLKALGIHDYYPYVYSNVVVDFTAQK
uniref:V-type proton ATPase subunit C n=1 Tax=Rhabditophanes sp. KR3021 TaxID=114890 RepID=A0AC35UF87_9BILA